MNLRKRIRYVGEVMLSHFGLAVLPFLPRVLILQMARTFGALAFRICKRTRRVAMANVGLAFGENLSSDEKLTIVKRAYKTFALVLLDLFWFARNTEKRVGKYVKFDSSCEAFFEIKPSISVTGHIGNWEILGQAIALKSPPFVAIAAPLQNPAVDRMLNRFRRGASQRVAYKKGAVRAGMKVLKEGGRVGLLLDQNVEPKDGGMFVDFFDVPVPMSSIAEKLSLRMELPVTFIFCIALEDGSYECRSPAPIKFDDSAAESEITRMIAHVFEDEIRKNPGQWLWMYKRWKFFQPGESQEKYPFYAGPIH